MPPLDRSTAGAATRSEPPAAPPDRAHAQPELDQPAHAAFDFHTAMSRSVGWVTPEELATLRTKRVAIAGLGGVGGSHLLTLTRLGVGGFNIADFDAFELANFNRQAGASMATIGQPKADVLARMALDINPTLTVGRFGAGVLEGNVDRFLDGIDLYVDSLDFFAVAARRLVFDQCAKRNIPAITAAPLGMSTALLCFMPGKMSFEEYFRLDGRDEVEQLLRFLVGLAPANLHRPYLVDPSAIDLVNRKGPSTPMGCELCAGVAASAALKILLNRGPVLAAPHGLQFDAYRNKLVRTWRPGGNRNPIQRLILRFARRVYTDQCNAALGVVGDSAAPKTHENDVIRRIIDAARWAPSGDNAQPWRFEILDNRRLIVRGRDTRDHCVYDLCGRASQLATGAMLETLRIAASGQGLACESRRRMDAPENEPTFDVTLTPDPTITADPLLRFVTQRSTQRRPMRRRPIETPARNTLQTAAGDDYELHWFGSATERLHMAALMFANAGIRLTMPEAYETHRDAIEWGVRYSDDRLPDKALGLDPLTLRLMRWVMRAPARVTFFNKYLAGTVAPRVQMDLLPGFFCGAHVLVTAPHRPSTIDDYTEAGRAVQRFWLRATSLGLQLQPEMTPLIFHSYIRGGLWFTDARKTMSRADILAIRLEQLLGHDRAERAVFLARIGYGPTPRSRSLRLGTDRLIVTDHRS